MKQSVKNAVTKGLIVYTGGEEIAAGIMAKALADRCSWVDIRLGPKKNDDANLKWGRYNYVFVSPAYYKLFRSSIEKLEAREGHFVAICTMNKTEFRELKKEHGDHKNGASKVMYICTTLFSLCGDVHE